MLSGLFWSPITKTCYRLFHVVISWNVDCHWLGSHPSHLGRWDWHVSHQSDNPAGITVCLGTKKWHWRLDAETELTESEMRYKWRSRTRFTPKRNKSLNSSILSHFIELNKKVKVKFIPNSASSLYNVWWIQCKRKCNNSNVFIYSQTSGSWTSNNSILHTPLNNKMVHFYKLTVQKKVTRSNMTLNCF